MLFFFAKHLKPKPAHFLNSITVHHEFKENEQRVGEMKQGRRDGAKARGEEGSESKASVRVRFLTDNRSRPATTRCDSQLL
jgi:hypothetical protein